MVIVFSPFITKFKTLISHSDFAPKNSYLGIVVFNSWRKNTKSKEKKICKPIFRNCSV